MGENTKSLKCLNHNTKKMKYRVSSTIKAETIETNRKHLNIATLT